MYQLGIDVGTTWTAAAITRDGVDGVHLVALGERVAAAPSMLYLAPDGTVVVGEAAQRHAVTDPGRTVREFKRRVGDPTPLVVAGGSWAPEDLFARLTRWVVDRVTEREGGRASRVSVTHPASWGSHRLESLGRALATLGVPATFVAEPSAAALYYADTERVPVGSTVAVYDLGGGTFDAAVVHKAAPGTFELRGRAEGIDRLGGIDFDDAVFEHVRAGSPEAFAELDVTDPAVLSALAQLRRECTAAKEALSVDTEVSIPVLLPGSAAVQVRLHRRELESMITERVDETVAALRRAISAAGLTPADLTAVLLVGGSSRIPLVATAVSEQLGRPVVADVDPKAAIAKGAALAGGERAVPVPRPRSPAVGASGAGWAWAGEVPTDVHPALPTPRPVPAAEVPSSSTRQAAAPGGRDVDGTGPEPDGWAWAQPAARGAAAPGLLVAAGAATAAVAVLAAVFLWPGGSAPERLDGLGQQVLPVAPSTTTSAPPLRGDPEPEPAPAPTPAPQPTADAEPQPTPEPAPTTPTRTETVTETVEPEAPEPDPTEPTEPTEPTDDDDDGGGGAGGGGEGE